MAVDRNKFVELGGFNRLFAPAYCEDVDLCFRAWRQGWRCIYDPTVSYGIATKAPGQIIQTAA